MPRVIRQHAAYVAFATLSLALAVGATLAVFTVVNALWLRPAPFADPDRVVMLVNDGGSNDMGYSGLERAAVERPARWAAFEAVAGQVITSSAMSGLTPSHPLRAGRGASGGARCSAAGDSSLAATLE